MPPFQHDQIKDSIVKVENLPNKIEVEAAEVAELALVSVK
jgi:hypothetical protein